MGKKSNPAKMQKRLNDMQQLYREWDELLPKLESARDDWKRAAKIIKKLEAFYFSDEFLHCCEATENKSELAPATEGEYSILGEDTIWNASEDQQQLAWEWMRDAMNTLYPHKK